MICMKDSAKDIAHCCIRLVCRAVRRSDATTLAPAEAERSTRNVVATLKLRTCARSLYMADYGGWTRKGAVLSDLTAQKQYGVSQDFIVQGIKSGKLEFRGGSVWGNPYLRVLRSQL